MEAIKRYSISKARENLSGLLKLVIGENRPVKLTRRGSQSGALLVPDRFEILTNKKAGYEHKLTLLIADYLLPDAQPNFVEAQIADLNTLNLEQLATLLKVKRLPLESEQREALSAIVGLEFLDRLEKRHRVAQSVKEAEELGLYEANEHHANKLPW
ncbi:prevent-host-death family protein [Desulfatibacillum aliphaticivorans]|uniref:Prevent-host-death family protein n=1 Tax=Desulfatibacillum aliphaticivorans TaxID=218208 RepID=B8FKP8_DESAL|nr:hypothetical protein [Desulfatibacillum aliphaticivorans]ACL04420.1 prevent-host-death family protein [Desulfatibacillum aliphaticivorans]